MADSDGRRFLHLSKGHVVPLTDDGLSLIGEAVRCYEGWAFDKDRWSVECFGLEGPKLLERGEWFYLASAQGGTAGPATSHMVVTARSHSPLGPWENAPNNPLVHTESRADQWWSRGHGTLIDDPAGDWWIVYHAYRKDYHTLGRQTLIEPVRWTEDGWPERETSPHRSRDLAAKRREPVDVDLPPTLGPLHWLRFDWFDAERVQISEDRVLLHAAGAPREPSEPLLLMALSRSYAIQANIDVAALQPDGSAGLVLHYNADCFCGIQVEPSGRIWVGREGNWVRTTESLPSSAGYRLRIVNREHEVSFFYALADGEWFRHWTTLETSGYHHNVFGKFLSLKPGIICLGEGTAEFSMLSHQNLEDS